MSSLGSDNSKKNEKVVHVVIDEYGSLIDVEIAKDGSYLCPLCKARFASIKDLINHILSHFS